MTTTARRTRGLTSAIPAMVALGLAACAPALDWRETHPEGTGATMLFPCRAERQARPVSLGDQTLALSLHSCTASDTVFALASADVSDASRVTPLLLALRAQAIANVLGVATAETLPSIPGSTPNAQSARLRILGQRPDGRPVVEHAVFFVRGLTLFQATVIGADEPADREAIDTFFGSIRLP